MFRGLGSAILAVLFAASGLLAQNVSNRQQVFFFKQVFKAKTKLGILCNKDQKQADLSEIDIAAMSYQVWSKAANVKSLGDVGSGLRNLLNKEKVEAILLLPDPIISTPDTRKFIIQQCMLEKIPVIGDSAEAVQDGAVYALVIKDNKVQVLLNLRAAAALDIQIPPEILNDATVLVQP